jgi:hypothetical protein
MAAEANGRAMTRMLIAIFEGDEGRGIVQVTRLIGLARLQNAAVRVAYFHSIPRDRTDRYGRIVSDRYREMLRIEEAMREAVAGVLRAAGRAPVECVVRFGAPVVEVARVADPPALRGVCRPAPARARGRRRRAAAGGGRHASRLTRPAASPILSSAT